MNAFFSFFIYYYNMFLHLTCSVSFPVDNFFVDDFARFTVLDSKDKTAAIANSMTYLTKKGNN